MLIRQFLDTISSTFTYLVAADYQQQAFIIDPVQSLVPLYNQFIEEFGLTLQYCVETHTHADHITGSGLLAMQHHAQIVMGEQSQANCVDIRVTHGQILACGPLELKALYTPGHTDDSYCYACNDALFTGDTLMIRGTGRADFQSGNPSQQYHSIHDVLFSYPDSTRVYPAHDYKIITMSTIGEEKRFNPRLQVDHVEAYVEIMNHLHLERPKQMDVAIPANLKCGLVE